MNEILERCAGLDVHKKTIVATIMIGLGKKVKQETKTFGTMTHELKDLGTWLQQNGIKEAAIESTGIYWVPVFNVLEEDLKINLTLANARHIKNVPGRKTDVKDSEWLCKLLKYGLIRGSFIPEADQRALRQWTRYRKKIVYNLTMAKNRCLKILEGSNIKLSSVISNVFSGSGWKIMKDLADGKNNPEGLIKHIGKQIKAPHESIKQALTGTLDKENTELLKFMVEDIEYQQKRITEIEVKIQELISKHKNDADRLQEIPGVGETIANTIIAEMGTNMDQFASDKHLSSWIGLAPGNNESAGKKKSTRITEGNKSLRAGLVEAAWAAISSKGTYFNAQFQRLRARRGAKKAIVAIARKIGICAYWILKKKTNYKELGAEYVDKRVQAARQRYHLKKLSELGFDVQLTKIGCDVA